MKNKLFTYLKQNKLTDISVINKLFVSIFIIFNNIKIVNYVLWNIIDNCFDKSINLLVLQILTVQICKARRFLYI